MKAEPKVQLMLLDLQLLDNQLARIASQVRKIETDPLLENLSKEKNNRREQYKKTLAEFEGLSSDRVKLEDDIDTAEKRVERNSKLLLTTSVPKEAIGLQAEMESVQFRITRLEDELIELMEKQQQAEATLEAQRQSETEIDEQIAAAKQQSATDLAALTEQKSTTLAEREELVARLPKELVELYDRQRSRYGYGASRLVGKVSEAAGLELSEQDYKIVLQHADDDVVLCPESQAILVRATAL